MPSKNPRDYVGKKVSVLVSLKPVERVLCEDSQGFYIRLENQRVPVTSRVGNIVTFTALSPKDRRAIEKMRAERASSFK